MAKIVIQVPVDEELLKDLDNISAKLHKARSEIIREACRRYLKEVKLEQLDNLYRQGYKKIPEQGEIGEAQAAIIGEIMSRESW